MKILNYNQKHGEITLKIDTLNDLWTLYNIISKDDIVEARTSRRVIFREGTKGDRKSMVLKLSVEELSFHEFSNRLRIKGTILEGPEDYVSFGTYHTFNVEVSNKISIIKEHWYKSELKRLKELSKFDANFIMFFIAIERGLATLAVITNFSHNTIATIKKNIPGKRYEQSFRNKAFLEFFEDIQGVLEENKKKMDIDLIIIAGPGNTPDMLLKFLREKANVDYLSKIKILHASSGTESAILEILKSKELSTIKKNVRIIEETKKIEEIFRLFSTDSDLIVIGSNETYKAAQRGAIKDLFLVDLLIRGASKKDKLKIEEIITNVENTGGKVHILSSAHPTGQQIIDLGSLVGILRYKLHD
ncbi:MAG: mRNA surveillance protein pelota [Promethearchaeota archaeon]|nr:MAG: mRNA surveillance protein pelota [Candidatus Lokiarchaeota archaeon]